MTWEETIKFIRTQPQYAELVRLAYLDEDVVLNVERFKNSEEFEETKKLIGEHVPLSPAIKLLDIGSGNGISAVAFAMLGIQVECVEPDPSATIGAGAIRKLKEKYQLANLTIHEGFAEELHFPPASFDIVYTRQCMHHAHNLQQFLKECSRVLKNNGVLVTIRDHVIFDEKDKEWFLENHPLQKFYGGENAFKAVEYETAISKAGLEVKQKLKHFDSQINYFPLSKQEKEKKGLEYDRFIQTLIEKKLRVFGRNRFFKKLATEYIEKKLDHPFDENLVPGRMYSYIASKNSDTH